MKSIQDLDYGHALCPNCRNKYDLSTSPSYVLISIGECRDKIYAFLCQRCDWEAGNSASQRENIESCCANNLRREHDLCWAAVSELALRLNNWDVVAAREFGCGLPKVIYDAVISGECDLWMPPCTHISYSAGR